MRIKYIIPFAFDDEGIAKRAVQVSQAALDPETHVECVPVKNHPLGSESYYDTSIFDMYVTEAGLRSEAEGYDAVVMDTVSDSGLYNLRCRLTIPVIGPGAVSYAVAAILGRRFSVICYLPKHKHIYEKTLDSYQLWNKCASIRAVGIQPDFENLFTEDPEHEFELLTAEAERAINEDGADVILLGSTTLYQAGEHMARHLPAPVINPGPVALMLAEDMVKLGLSHSKVAFPTPTVIQDNKWESLVSVHEDAESKSVR